MKIHWKPHTLLLTASFNAVAQSRGSSPGTAIGLFIGIIIVLAIGWVAVRNERTVGTLFRFLGGLALMCLISACVAALASGMGLVQRDQMPWVAGATLMLLFVVPAGWHYWHGHNRTGA